MFLMSSDKYLDIARFLNLVPIVEDWVGIMFWIVVKVMVMVIRE